MKRLLPLLLLPVALAGIAATTYTITQLTANNSPSDGTLIEIYDPSASPKSGKYVLTNLVKRAGDNMGPLSVTAFTNSAATASRLAVTGSDKALGSVSTTGLVDGTGAAADASDVTGALGYTPLPKQPTVPVTVNYSSSLSLDFQAAWSQTNAPGWLVLGGSTTLSSANLAAGYGVTLYVDNTQSTNCNVILPSGWRKVSGATTNIIGPGNIGILSVFSRAANDTNVVCLWASE